MENAKLKTKPARCDAPRNHWPYHAAPFTYPSTTAVASMTEGLSTSRPRRIAGAGSHSLQVIRDLGRDQIAIGEQGDQEAFFLLGEASVDRVRQSTHVQPPPPGPCSIRHYAYERDNLQPVLKTLQRQRPRGAENQESSRRRPYVEVAKGRVAEQKKAAVTTLSICASDCTHSLIVIISHLHATPPRYH